MTRILFGVFMFLSFIQLPLQGQNVKSIEDKRAEETCKPMCFTSEFIELGAVKKGDKVPFKFEFENTSDEKIKISFIDACECSDVTYPKSYINPGSQASFDVIFDSSKKDNSEIITIYFELTSIDPATELPYFKELKYSYDLKKE